MASSPARTSSINAVPWRMPHEQFDVDEDTDPIRPERSRRKLLDLADRPLVSALIWTIRFSRPGTD